MTDDLVEGTIVGSPRWFLGSRMTVLATADETGGAYGLMVQQARRGFSPPLHCHAREDDAYVVLEGELTFQLDGAGRLVGAGSHVFLPRGVPHTFRVESETASWIELVTPGGAEAWHLECSDPALHDGFPDDEPIDVDRVLRTIEPYEIAIVGPPLPARTADGA